VAEELGTWPPEQATVLLEVLQKAGIKPDAKRTREGVVVTVPDEAADEAHRELVANMDAIARAARRERPKAAGRRPRPVKGADHPSDRQRQREMASERLKGAANPLIIAIVLVVVLALFIRSPIVWVVLLGGLVYFIGKRAQQRGDDPGRGGRY
jgi:ribosomal protein L12E/L44/L45/RPP1/RPP2